MRLAGGTFSWSARLAKRAGTLAYYGRLNYAPDFGA
jgi:hypothetical protein